MAVTGEPCRLLYAFPNGENGDALHDLHVGGAIAITTSTRSVVTVHRMPDFAEVASRRLPGLVSAVIYNGECIATVQGKKPFIYNAELGVAVATLKRAVIPTAGNVIFSSLACSSTQLFAATTGSALCTWDVRDEAAPNVVTFPKSLGIQSIAVGHYMIALGCANGKIAILDARNPRYRVRNFDIEHRTDPVHVTTCDDEPWAVGFQCTSGAAGVLDTMSGAMSIFKSPPFEVEQVAGRHTPVFAHSRLCVAYPWSCRIQVIDSDVETVQAPADVIALAACPTFDGVFAACSSGDVWHIL